MLCQFIKLFVLAYTHKGILFLTIDYSSGCIQLNSTKSSRPTENSYMF